MDLSKKRVLVTGGAGFVGRVLCDKLRQRGCREILVPRRAEYDLTSEEAVQRLYADMRPEVVIHLAAEVGGIGANMDSSGRFFYANMAMALHLIEHARRVGLEQFVQVGTICAYPKFCPVPFEEQNLWNGYPEETNAPYGIAKKAAMVMLDAYHHQYGLKGTYVLPVNLYGPYDNFDLHTSHVIPALIRKCEAAIDRGDNHMTCWGTGKVSREFLYVDDAAEGILRASESLSENIAATCPACIPALAAMFSAMGIGFVIGIKVLIFLTIGLLALGLVGLYVNFRKHGRKIFLIIGLIASIALYFAQYADLSKTTFYGGAAVLFVNAILDYRHTKKTKACCAVKK